MTHHLPVQRSRWWSTVSLLALCVLVPAIVFGNGMGEAGATVGATVELRNISGEGQPMTVAIVGLPAGLEARVDQLDELKEAGKYDYYEINARELIFYWRSLSPEADQTDPIRFTLDLVAEIPGRYTAPASRTYLYYTPEQKHWTDPLKVQIARE